MAVNNRAGSIIAKNIVGATPTIFYDDQDNRYALRMVVSNSAYNDIISECQRVELEINRNEIDEFVHCIYDFDKACSPVYTDNVRDEEVLAGERLRINGLKGEYADLLKIRQREYICTDGVCKGQILLMPTSIISLDNFAKGFSMTSMAFLPPTEAHYLLDYRYLNLYKTKVADSIDNLYRATSLAFVEGTVESSFPELLRICSELGQSTWTLRGIVDFLSLRNQK